MGIGKGNNQSNAAGATDAVTLGAAALGIAVRQFGDKALGALLGGSGVAAGVAGIWPGTVVTDEQESMHMMQAIERNTAGELENARGAASSRREDPHVVRLQLQQGKNNIDSYALKASGDPGVLKEQVWLALGYMYDRNATSNEDWNKVLGNSVVNMSEKVKALHGGVSGVGNVLRTEFVYGRKLYRIDLENLNGTNLTE